MAVYLELFHEFSDRFLTGTDFVASYGKKVNKMSYLVPLTKNNTIKMMPELNFNLKLNYFLYASIINVISINFCYPGSCITDLLVI